MEFMGTLVSIVLVATAFLTVVAVLYFVVTEKQGSDQASSMHDGTVIDSANAPSVPVTGASPAQVPTAATGNVPAPLASSTPQDEPILVAPTVAGVETLAQSATAADQAVGEAEAEAQSPAAPTEPETIKPATETRTDSTTS